jgi:hypothetical protein
LAVFTEFEIVASKSLQDFARGVVTSSGALTGSSDDGQKTKIDPISAISLITTFIPFLVDMLKKCRSLKNDQVQGYVASRHSSDKTRVPQEKQAAAKLLAHCKRCKKEEVKNAKKTGIPADFGRYEIDDETALRVCHNMIGNFAAMGPVTAEGLVAEASTGA